MGALLNYNIRQTSGFVIAAGAILGVCAGLLWTAQGSLTLSYATEKTKGRLFALFWMIFNLGGVLGSAIELGLVYHSETNTVGNGVYIVFMTIAAVVSLVPATLVSPDRMIRSDGTRVIPPTHPSESRSPLFNLRTSADDDHYSRTKPVCWIVQHPQARLPHLLPLSVFPRVKLDLHVPIQLVQRRTIHTARTSPQLALVLDCQYLWSR